MGHRFAFGIEVGFVFALVACGVAYGFHAGQELQMLHYAALFGIPSGAALGLGFLCAFSSSLAGRNRWESPVMWTFPLLFGALVVLFAKLMLTTPNALSAPNEVLRPVFFWLTPGGVAVMVGVQMAVAWAGSALLARAGGGSSG